MSERFIRVVAAVVAEDDRYLITQRRSTAVLPNMWEFPGGRVERGETDEQALAREIEERLGVPVKVGELMSFVSHDYPSYSVNLYLYACRLLDSNLVRKAVQDYRWIRSDEFEAFAFTPADEASMAKLLGLSPAR